MAALLVLEFIFYQHMTPAAQDRISQQDHTTGLHRITTGSHNRISQQENIPPIVLGEDFPTSPIKIKRKHVRKRIQVL